MAIAASPIIRSKGLLDLLRQAVPPQERAVEIYHRLLAINHLAASMNSAKDVDQLQNCLIAYFQECLPNDSIRFCIIEGNKYRKSRLSGPNVPSEEEMLPLDYGLAGSVLKSGTPLWIPDTNPPKKIGRLARVETETLLRSIMALPFSTQGRVVGCLEMVSNEPNRFDEIEYHLGFLVAAHLSSSLENVLTRQELATANARLRDHDLRLTQLNQKLQQLAHTDEVTAGLFNKRRLFERLDMEIARARRYGEILSCLMLDIDDFKQINDTHGHQAGDEVLRQIGAIVRRALRITDFVARYGGEEFTILLPRTDSAGAYRVAENLRSIFRSHEFILSAAKIHLTVSIGVASCTTFDRLDAPQIIQWADDALYQAKRGGKDRACFAKESGPEYREVKILSNL